MLRTRLCFLVVLSLSIELSVPCLAKDWKVRRTRGIIKVVHLDLVSSSLTQNYAEGLVRVDKENNIVPSLAEDWRWVDDRTIEFKLRKGVTFHNHEGFDAEAVRINWENYRRMEAPRPFQLLVPPDGTLFQAIDDYKVRFSFPKPNGLALVQFQWFLLFAPTFFDEHEFDEKNWGYLPKAGPWGTGPFKLVEGSLRFGKPTKRVVLEAYEEYWDPRYPGVQRVIFDNKLIGTRDEAMRLCMEAESSVDIVSCIRPLDTLRVAESALAKVVKSKDPTCLHGTFNLRKRVSKLRDIRVRKAINYAINREELKKYAARGNAYGLGGFIPRGAYGYNPNLTLYTYDTSRAKWLLAEAGIPNGFEMKIITHEALKLEAKIISRMLERIGLKMKLEVFTYPELLRKIYIPILDKPPAEQDWDITIFNLQDRWSHAGAILLSFNLIEESDWRWIMYDPVYEEMWKDMIMRPDREAQEKKLRQMVEYVYDSAYLLFIYSPMTLYAVNKEVNFAPYKNALLNLRETSVTDNHWSVRGKND